jgi:hypothetical protein
MKFEMSCGDHTLTTATNLADNGLATAKVSIVCDQMNQPLSHCTGVSTRVITTCYTLGIGERLAKYVHTSKPSHPFSYFNMQ